MVNSEYIKNFIYLLPNIFIYIAPGYLFSLSLNYVLNWKVKELNKNLLEYILSSYIICSIFYFGLSFIYKTVILNLANVVMSIIIFSLISGFILGKFLQSDFYTITLRDILHIKRTLHSNIFYDLIDKEKGTWVRIYLKNEQLVYFGALVAHEQKEKYDDGFIVINRYVVYKYGECNSKIFDEQLPVEYKENFFASIKVSEISRIETIYDPSSNILDHLLIKRTHDSNCNSNEGSKLTA